MKKILLLCSLIIFSISSFSQTCEERETKLLSTVNGFSAGMLYNTYGLIGAIADGYMKDAYKKETLSDLMNAQKGMADNFIKMIQENLKENVFSSQADNDYMTKAIEVIKGLKLQAQLLIDIAETNSGKKKNAYEEQRQKNWTTLSKLMGIEE